MRSLQRPIFRGIPLGSATVRSRQRSLPSSRPRALSQAELSSHTLSQSSVMRQDASMMSDPRQQGNEAVQSASPTPPSPPLPPVVNWFVTPKCNYGCKVLPA